MLVYYYIAFALGDDHHMHNYALVTQKIMHNTV